MKESLIQQYMSICAGYRMTPIAVQTLQRLVFSSRETLLNLSRHGLTKLSLKAFLEAVTGTGQHIEESNRAIHLNTMRGEFGDEMITMIDVSHNDIQVCVSPKSCHLNPKPCTTAYRCADPQNPDIQTLNLAMKLLIHSVVDWCVSHNGT
jgi:hypothetical protein